MLDRTLRPRRNIAFALALLGGFATVGFAQDEPERVRRFDAPAQVRSSWPWWTARTDSTLFVVQQTSIEFGMPVRLWRLQGPDPTPEVVADLRYPSESWALGQRGTVALGETLVTSSRGLLWRIEPNESPRLVGEFGSGNYDWISPVGSALGVAYLSVGNDDTGTELWRTDGTADGTSLVRDIEPGPVSAWPHSGVTVGSTLFFNATTLTHGSELWRTDGTTEGTVLAVDLVPGSGSSSVIPIRRWGASLLAAGQNTGRHRTLWRTDGTPEGTRTLFNGTSEIQATHFHMEFGDLHLFGATRGATEEELWVTDGTEGGARRVADINATAPFAVVDGFAYFAGRIAYGPTQLWRTDGTTEGTSVVALPGPDRPDVEVSRAVALGDVLLFVLHTATYPSVSELWSTDGTLAGTSIVRDDLGIWRWSGIPNDYYGGFLAATDDAAWFVAGSFEGAEVWVTDGTADGTRAVNLATDRAPAVHEMAAGDGSLFLVATEEDAGREVWVSDGTTDGTRELTDLNDETGSTYLPGALTPFDDGVLFVGNPSNEIWHATSGSAASLVEVERGGETGYVSGSLVVNDLVYFRAAFATGTTGWRTDGTQAGTIQIGGVDPYGFHDVGSAVLFFSKDGINYRDLWRSDGTALGTRLLKDLNPPVGQTGPGAGAVVGNTLFFAANGDASGKELWQSDSSTPGTFVTDLVPGSAGSAPEGLLAAGNRLFFNAIDANGVRRLHARDADGTIVDLWDAADAPAAYDRPVPHIALGDDVLFVANDGATGRELWVTDGTVSGTELVRDLREGVAGSEPHGFVDLGDGRAVFAAFDDGRGRELWVTDGTEDGTFPVADLVAGPGSANPIETTLVGDDLFVATDGEGAARDLWRIPVAHLDGLEQPAPLPALEPLPPLPPDGPEPAPPPDPPPPPSPPPDPEPLALDKLHIRLDTKRDDRDGLHARFRVPIDCGEPIEGTRVRVDIGGVPIDVTLDGRGRATSVGGVAKVRARTVKPRRRRDDPTEVRIDVRVRRGMLQAALADENLVVPDGEKRVDRPVDIDVLWCDLSHIATATVRVKARRRVTTARLIDVD